MTDEDRQPLLECRQLVKHFPLQGSKKVVQAVNDVSFSIDRGQTLALVGESGSGKSTIGKLILELISLTSGSVLFRGSRVSDLPRAEQLLYRQKVQAVFQDPYDSLNPRHTIGVSVAEPLIRTGAITSKSGIRARVLECIEMVGLRPPVLKSYPHQLSGSELQRVGIARAMATDPEFIVLDEPTSALSPTARAEVIRTLRAIQQETEVSYLFITHDLTVIRSIAERIAVMYLGRIVEEGNAEQIFERPRHPYTSALLDSVLFPEYRERGQFKVLKGEIPSPIDIPLGCAFASRCAHKTDRCLTEIPDLLPVPQGASSTDHEVACFVAQARTPDFTTTSTRP